MGEVCEQEEEVEVGDSAEKQWERLCTPSECVDASVVVELCLLSRGAGGSEKGRDRRERAVSGDVNNTDEDDADEDVVDWREGEEKRREEEAEEEEVEVEVEEAKEVGEELDEGGADW